MNSASRKKEYEELTGLPYKSAPTTAGNGGGLERSTAAAATAVANNWTTKNDLAK